MASIDNLKNIESSMLQTLKGSIDVDKITAEGISLRIGNRLIKFTLESDNTLDIEDEIRKEFRDKVSKRLEQLGEIIQSKMNEVSSIVSSYKKEFDRKEKLLTDELKASAKMPNISLAHAMKGLSIVKGSNKDEIVWLYKGIYYPRFIDRKLIDPKFSKRLITNVVFLIKTENSYVKELTVRKMSDLSKFSHYHEMTNSSDCWGNFKWQRNCSTPEEIITLAKEAEAVLENVNSLSLAKRNPTGLPRFDTLYTHIVNDVKIDSYKDLSIKPSMVRDGVEIKIDDDDVWLA